jgi:hypothetical protein
LTFWDNETPTSRLAAIVIPANVGAVLVLHRGAHNVPLPGTVFWVSPTAPSAVSRTRRLPSANCLSPALMPRLRQVIGGGLLGQG